MCWQPVATSTAARPVPKSTTGRASPISLDHRPREVESPRPSCPESLWPKHCVGIGERGRNRRRGRSQGRKGQRSHPLRGRGGGEGGRPRIFDAFNPKIADHAFRGKDRVGKNVPAFCIPTINTIVWPSDHSPRCTYTSITLQQRVDCAHDSAWHKMTRTSFPIYDTPPPTRSPVKKNEAKAKITGQATADMIQ